MSERNSNVGGSSSDMAQSSSVKSSGSKLSELEQKLSSMRMKTGSTRKMFEQGMMNNKGFETMSTFQAMNSSLSQKWSEINKGGKRELSKENVTAQGSGMNNTIGGSITSSLQVNRNAGTHLNASLGEKSEGAAG